MRDYLRLAFDRVPIGARIRAAGRRALLHRKIVLVPGALAVGSGYLRATSGVVAERGKLKQRRQQPKPAVDAQAAGARNLRSRVLSERAQSSFCSTRHTMVRPLSAPLCLLSLAATAARCRDFDVRSLIAAGLRRTEGVAVPCARCKVRSCLVNFGADRSDDSRSDARCASC